MNTNAQVKEWVRAERPCPCSDHMVKFAAVLRASHDAAISESENNKK